MKKINRRRFVEKTAAFTLSLSLPGLSKLSATRIKYNRNIPMKASIVDERTYLESILYTKKEVDDWLAGRAFPFSRYHSEFGWLLPNARFRDGIDESVSIYTYRPGDGERLMSNYKEMPCRINTYGDSFTQCHQVSDHETWQEILAAHLQEPVRNYGIGGWSVYQAYLRMIKEEEIDPADYIIFNIYEDDHKRNLDSWRNIRVHKHPQHIEAPLPYLKVDLTKKTVTTCINPCPTVDSLYNLCDLDKSFELFKEDFVLKIMIAHLNAGLKSTPDNYEDLKNLIKTHGITTNIDDSQTLAEEAEKLHLQAAMFSSKFLVDKITAFAQQNRKKVLFVLSYPGKTIAKYIKEGVRFDQTFVDFLDSKNLPYVDLMQAHSEDYKRYKGEIQDYIGQYFIGHYNPMGNFFCAFILKKNLLKMLDPKPQSYGAL